LHSFRTLLVVAAWVNTEDTANVIAVTGDTKLAERITPFVQKLADCFADFVFAIFGVVTGAADRIDWSAG